MTKEEYQKLARRSVSFKAMDGDQKGKVLVAEGEERESYVKMFEEEAQFVVEAFEELIDANDKIVGDFKADYLKNQRDELKVMAENAQDADVDTAESLLTNLNNIK